MKDFRKVSTPAGIEQQRASLIKRLVMIQTLGAPLFLAAAVSGLAYFGDTALLPLLEDRKISQTILAVSVVGLGIEGWLSFKTIRALSSLKDKA